jgi:hypothetical protein
LAIALCQSFQTSSAKRSSPRSKARIK